MLSFPARRPGADGGQVAREPTENPAQIRVHIGDLSQSNLSRWISFLNYERATQTSVGNAKLLQAVSQQLRVPRAEALQTTQDLLNTKLVCSLGGKYELVDRGDGQPMWRRRSGRSPVNRFRKTITRRCWTGFEAWTWISRSKEMA